ncbi:hypothetical protein LG651_15345 [Tamlana sp. 62-3]|uniref:Uncharacterized protein n=1 Tax=Neotamlana sargassicola TaxID=2883125 RepID=A0A9X1L5Z8_9FLAO|nr:hypothetical protein [Tamlana sargassicola]MCB4809630.1 hypothetical protein [Tamlana sargassicola]
MEEFQIRYNKTSELIEKVVDMYYNGNSCACEYPRFIQIVGINCVDYGKSFKTWETTLLIDKAKKHFETETLENGPECSNEKWTCKKCKSEYNYGWSDFSIAVEREVLLPIKIKATEKGKKTIKPIPLYAGLYGHSYPSKKEIESVTFDSFEKYIMEK